MEKYNKGAFYASYIAEEELVLMEKIAFSFGFSIHDKEDHIDV